MSGVLLTDRNRQTIPAPKNPFDKATVVSIYPKRIKEIKSTIQPGLFILESGSYNNPFILHIGGSSWWREVDPEQPLLEIPVSSIAVADSIVRDYCNGLLGVTMPDVKPGIFYVPGEINIIKLKTDYKKALESAKVQQDNWFRELVRLADGFWARTNGNPLSITDDMRMAARELGLENKDWIKDHMAAEMVKCVACGALRNPEFPICGTCHNIIDKEKATKLGIVPAA